MTKPVHENAIKVTDAQHLIDMGRTHGLLMALEAIKSAMDDLKLPGLGVAYHAIKAVEAEQRVSVMQKNIRLAVKSGADLDNVNVYWEGRDEIWTEPLSDAVSEKP